jgi:hypothetical protein
MGNETAMTKQAKPAFRIALRDEGTFWNAYLAPIDSMDNALHIGSLRMSIARNNVKAKQAFIELMQSVMTDAAQDLGVSIAGYQIHAAPESERGGHS